MVESARLESVFTLTGNEGSNPSLSTIKIKNAEPFRVWLFYFVDEVPGREPFANEVSEGGACCAQSKEMQGRHF